MIMPEEHSGWWFSWIMSDQSQRDRIVAGLNEQIASNLHQIEALWQKEHPPMGPILKLLEQIKLCENRLLLLS